ncbi:hypothetical protein HANVADRAFT_88233 [Hanseniaspora valbyensis NRRL Y-1626]|uniref:Cue1 Ubc7p-binding domain-containing protein n=2 Tax=Hanseniaspora valbyensis NRRL Y-1626 TaxID=766949 RepID=A0A1B7T8U1_9ASCO|nr:hypothetical protein HANVADRAFT_88233 [Hanseniaspora valbyensis NRRL Y-1626]
MSNLSIALTISLAIISFIVLYSRIGKLNGSDNNNAASKRSNIHPSILRLQEQERLEQEQQNQQNQNILKPEYDMNGNLALLYHNESRYPALTNSLRRERIALISNEMIQQVRDCVGNVVSLEQIVFDLELTGNACTTIDNYFESGLEQPPADYYIVPPAEEELASNEPSEERQSEVANDEQASFDEQSATSNTEQQSPPSTPPPTASENVFMTLNKMYLNPQNLITKYNIDLSQDYTSFKDSSSMKDKARYMIWKARRNVEKLDEQKSLRR